MSKIFNLEPQNVPPVASKNRTIKTRIHVPGEVEIIKE